jgi:hypothetical protein
LLLIASLGARSKCLNARGGKTEKGLVAFKNSTFEAPKMPNLKLKYCLTFHSTPAASVNSFGEGLVLSYSYFGIDSDTGLRFCSCLPLRSTPRFKKNRLLRPAPQPAASAAAAAASRKPPAPLFRMLPLFPSLLCSPSSEVCLKCLSGCSA